MKKFNEFKQTNEKVERLSYDDAYNILDIAAGYTSTQDQAANQQWNDAQDLYDYLKSDHIPKKFHKKFYKSIKANFPLVTESIDETIILPINEAPMDKNFLKEWEKNCKVLLTHIDHELKKNDRANFRELGKLKNWVQDAKDVPNKLSKLSGMNESHDLSYQPELENARMMRSSAAEFTKFLERKAYESNPQNFREVNEGIKDLLLQGAKITKRVGEDKLIKLSDAFEDLDDEQADEIASSLNMAIEKMQDGYPADATGWLKKFNKDCKNALKK